MNLAHYSIQREKGKQFKEKHTEFKRGKNKTGIQKVTKISKLFILYFSNILLNNKGGQNFGGFLP